MYIIILLWLFIFLLIGILLKQLNVKKNYIFCFLITFLIILFTLNMNSCISAALDGCKLVVKSIIPTILPFCVICNLLIQYDGIDLYSKIIGPLFCKPLGLSKNCSFPMAASFLCGYPLGAKYTCDIYKNGYITQQEFIRLSNIASNAGPIFLLGAIGASMLNSTLYGYILLIGNYVSALFIGIILKPKNKPIFKNIKTNNKTTVLFGDAMKSAIDNAISTTLNVAAYVIIFSVIISIIKNNEYTILIINDIENLFKLPNNSLYALLLGSIEMTNGAKLISELSLNVPLKLGLISFLCSFSGLSIIAQVSSFFAEYKLPMKPYIIKKFIQGIFSFLITFLISNILLPESINTSSNTLYFSYTNFLSFSFITITFLSMTLIYSIIKIKVKK